MGVCGLGWCGFVWCELDGDCRSLEELPLVGTKHVSMRLPCPANGGRSEHLTVQDKLIQPCRGRGSLGFYLVVVGEKVLSIP